MLQSNTKRPSCAVESVIVTDELSTRPSRGADYEAENRVLLKLAVTMANEPSRVFQELADNTRELCRAGSAGISLLDPQTAGADLQFRWVATSGAFSQYAGNTMPRNFSLCGTVLDFNRTLLMADTVRHFPYIYVFPLPVTEVFLVPFHRGAEPIGTVWVASHTAGRRFDREDARVLAALSQFA